VSRDARGHARPGAARAGIRGPRPCELHGWSRRVIAIVLVAALAGCARRHGPVTIRFWAMGREGEVVSELVRDFEREHPGVRVRVQQIPWTAAHEKLLTAYVGDATPDLAQLGNSWIPEFAALNALAPLDPRIARSTVVGLAHDFPGIWAGNVVDGVTYGVPWYVDTRVLFYRRDLLRAAGYDRMPTTWSGWREAMRALRARSGNSKYAIFLPVNEWAQPVILGLQAGSPMLRDHDTRGAFSEPEFRRAFDFLLDLYRERLAPPISANEIANAYQEFGRGTFAMWITGPWQLGEFASRLPPELQGAWDTAPLPGPDGDSTGVSLAGGSSLVLFRGSKHPELAWQLVEFLSRPEQQVRFWRLTGDLPARREAWNDTALVADRRMQAFRTQLQRIGLTPMIPEWEAIATRVLEHTETAARGAVTPEAALAALDKDVDLLLEKRRWLLARAALHGSRP
jgi:multiple sugar transport system substrate-binding protein